MKWGEGMAPNEGILPIEWCNAYTGERHAVFNVGGLMRAMKMKGTRAPTHWRFMETWPPLPQPDKVCK